MANPTASRPRAQRRPAKPVPRFVRVLEPADGDAGLLRIVNGNDVDAYWFKPISADFGRQAFELRKLRSAEVYCVLLAGRESSCECKGFVYHGHCKHVDSLTALAGAGRLGTPAPGPAAPPIRCNADLDAF